MKKIKLLPKTQELKTCFYFQRKKENLFPLFQVGYVLLVHKAMNRTHCLSPEARAGTLQPCKYQAIIVLCI